MGSSRSYSVTSPHSNSSTGGVGNDSIRHMKSDGHLPILETHEEKVVYIQVSNVAVFSPSIIQGMVEGRGLGVACGHIKAFGLLSFSHQRNFCTEGL